MKSKKEVLYIIGIALICWVLIFTMIFLPYNKFEFSWLEQGIKESTALLLGFAVMLCVLVYFQWKVYEEKCFSDWGIKKLLIITIQSCRFNNKHLLLLKRRFLFLNMLFIIMLSFFVCLTLHMEYSADKHSTFI